jgi:hypothetical protein
LFRKAEGAMEAKFGSSRKLAWLELAQPSGVELLSQ